MSEYFSPVWPEDNAFKYMFAYSDWIRIIHLDWSRDVSREFPTGWRYPKINVDGKIRYPFGFVRFSANYL